MLKLVHTLRTDAEWRIIAAIISGLALCAGAAVHFGGLAAAVALVAGVGLGCFVQAVMLHLQRSGG